MAEGKDVVLVVALVDWVVHENTVSWSWTSSCCSQVTLYGTCSIPSLFPLLHITTAVSFPAEAQPHQRT